MTILKGSKNISKVDFPKYAVVIVTMTSDLMNTLFIIFGVLTPLLQPADVNWNKIFKCEIKYLWSKWRKKGEKKFMKSGKYRSASNVIISQKVKAGGEKVSEDLIK